jgi:deoxyribonuclease-1
MRIDVKQGLILFLALASPTVPAQEGNIKQRMLGEVYAEGGRTLFCRASFQGGENVKLNRLYRQQQILDQFDCISQSQCENRDDYQAAISDPHNIYPVKSGVELDRRGTRFGDLREDIEVAGQKCPYQLSFQTFDPPEFARGNVARAMLYMHAVHDLPLIGSLEMYQRWSRQDPPDAAERERNQAIKTMTGQGNVFIATPEKADEIMPEEPKRLQFGG